MERFRDISTTSRMPLIQAFQKPSLDSKPMARMWFPDASPGAIPNDCIEKQLSTMAQGGMGGVEIAFLSDGSGIEDAEKYGWGTPNWVKTLKKIMKTARKIPGGFKVDFTISPHWPPNVYTIDPNDAAASSDLYYAYRKVTAADIQQGKMEVPMPEMKLRDQKGNPFIFKYTFVGASLACVSDVPRPKMRGFRPPPEFGAADGYQVIGALPDGVKPVSEAPEKKDTGGFVPPEGMEFVPEGMRREDIDWSVPFEPLPWRSRAFITLEFDSLMDVTNRSQVLPGKGWACGVPDEEALRRWYGGSITTSQVDEAFGPPADPDDLLPDGKRDSHYHRVRMADWQECYQVELNNLSLTPASDGEEFQKGDLILIGFFYRGSGQQLSGGGPWKIMPGQTYVANYLIPEGADAITNYWDRHILSDPELLEMVKDNGAEVGGSIFEDSIELHTYGAPWGKNFSRYIPEKMGYPIGDYLPILAGFATDNPEETRRITQDFAASIGKLYTQNHVERVKKWARSFNYNFRAQAYSLGGLGIVEAALATDVTEGDNSTYDDALRQLQTAVNVKPDEKFLSMESNTFNKFGFSWKSLAREVNYNASQGVNRVIFHGTAYPKTATGYMDWWPGWNWGERLKAVTFMAWDNRNLWWEDAHRLTDYLSRLQTVLQEGKRRVDLAILPSMQLMYELGEGNSHQYLLDRGYSYNLLDENVFKMENGTVKNGKWFPDGPGYRVLVLSDCDYIHEATLNRIFSLAEQGLPVVLEGVTPRQVFGISRPGNQDSRAMEILSALQKLPNVYVAEDDAELDQVLKSADLGPQASYQQEKLECSALTDGQAMYFYFFNGNEETVTVETALSGTGTPILLDCWQGKLKPIPVFQQQGKRISVSLTIAAGDMAIVALLPDVPYHAAEKMEALPEQVIDHFSLKLTSFGPPEQGDSEYDPYYPTTYHKETVSFEHAENFSSWSRLPADQEMLHRLRVRSMADVSGVGIYKGSFTLPADAVAADLKLAHHYKDVPTSVQINGMEAGTPDCMTDVLLIDDFIHPGENQIEIKVVSTLDNRCYAYDEVAYASFPKEKDVMAKLRPPFPVDYSIRYPLGLYAAAVVPYRKRE